MCTTTTSTTARKCFLRSGLRPRSMDRYTYLYRAMNFSIPRSEPRGLSAIVIVANERFAANQVPIRSWPAVLRRRRPGATTRKRYHQPAIPSIVRNSIYRMIAAGGDFVITG
jgi:hypothetical protein